MPRATKGPRLYFRKDRRVWIIRDGSAFFSTGCGSDDRAGAEKRLAEYIAEKHTPARNQREIAHISVADVISIYARDVAVTLASQKQVAGRLSRLLEWWGDKHLSDVTGANCRAYAASRPSTGGARRDLQDLAAAINHHHKEQLHREAIRVWLPPAGNRRERWLTRSEIARLVWSAWTMRMVMPTRYNANGAPRRPTVKRTGRHIARAILFAYYTGSRIGTALTASWERGQGRSYIDLERGVFYRLPMGKTETNKRQPPTPLGDRILAHVRRWRRCGVSNTHVVEWEGQPIASIKSGFNRAADAAGLVDGVSPHTLRHSRATHMKQAGVPSWEVAGALGMTEAMVERVYGHHDPAYLRRAANAR